MGVTVIGLQEVNDGRDDLMRWLPNRWGIVADPIGDNDIVYRTDRWRLVTSKIHDLIGDGHRHLTVAVFERLDTRERVTVGNAHLPSSGVGKTKQDRARKNLAKIIGAIDGPVILLGDLNTEGESATSARGLLRGVGVRFIREQVTVQNGREPSHWNFGKNKPGDGWIDDIGTAGGAIVTEARLKTMHDLSDHNALLARASF